MFGVGDKPKGGVVYSGRGRPPKTAFMSLHVATETHQDSSDEGDEAESTVANEGADPSNEMYEYSEEDTDEEVGVVSVSHDLRCMCMCTQTPNAKENLQKRIKTLKKVGPL